MKKKIISIILSIVIVFAVGTIFSACDGFFVLPLICEECNYRICDCDASINCSNCAMSNCICEYYQEDYPFRRPGFYNLTIENGAFRFSGGSSNGHISYGLFSERELRERTEVLVRLNEDLPYIGTLPFVGWFEGDILISNDHLFRFRMPARDVKLHPVFSPTAKPVNYTFFVNSNRYLVWGEIGMPPSLVNYRIYLENFYGLEFVGIAEHNQKCLVKFNFTVGQNTVKLVAVGETVTYYSFEYRICDSAVNTIWYVNRISRNINSVTIMDDVLRWAIYEPHRKYILREGSDEFDFVAEVNPAISIQARGTSLSRFNFTLGTNVIRGVTDISFFEHNREDNILYYKDSGVSYWIMEISEEDTLQERHFFVDGDSVSFGSSDSYRIYVRRNLEEDFSFLYTTRSGRFPLSMLNLVYGKYTVRAVSAEPKYHRIDNSNNSFRRGRNTVYWNFELILDNKDEVVIDNSFFVWHDNRFRVRGVPFRIYKQNTVTGEFLFILQHNITSLFCTSSIPLSYGVNVIRIVTVENIHRYSSGQLKKSRIASYWTVYM
ncbi:MAG: hypothetical protein FWE13_05585 [Firmicutes bacterium]|nr:hypothetical protein [Bacillota bacterium]